MQRCNSNRLSGPPGRARRLVTGVATVLVGIGLVACGAPSATVSEPGGGAVPQAASDDPLAPQPLAERTTLTVALSGRVEPFAAVLLADKLGEFEKENLAIELASLPPAESMLLATQGQTDVGFGTFTAAYFNLVAQGSPIRFVFPGSGIPEQTTHGYWVNTGKVNTDGGDLSAAELAAAQVDIASGDSSGTSYHWWRYLRTLPGGANLAPADLHYGVLDGSSAAEALKSGASAVGFVSSPFNQQLESQACCQYLKGVVPPEETQGGYFFGSKMADRQEAGAAFVRALGRTVTTYLKPGYRHDDTVMTALAEVLQLDRARLDTLPELTFSQTFATDVEQNIAGQEFFRGRGLLRYDTDLTADQVYDTRYVQAIGATGK